MDCQHGYEDQQSSEGHQLSNPGNTQSHDRHKVVFEGNQQNIEGHRYSYEGQTSCPGYGQDYVGHQLS